jgi:sulfite exporter TauE/SafE
MIVTAFLLGFFGSFTHCVGMCSGVVLLLSRRSRAQGLGLVWLQLGRILTYGGLGAAAGTLGLALRVSGHHGGSTQGSTLALWQGSAALLMALSAGYMALSLLGRAPSPELAFAGLSRRWGQMMRAPRLSPLSPIGLGLLWGLLPCGLVLSALLVAVGEASPWLGASVMLAFGLGTWPVTLGLSQAGRRLQWQSRLRPVTALLLLLVAGQMSLRGLAAWGMVSHQHLGTVMLW